MPLFASIRARTTLLALILSACAAYAQATEPPIRTGMDPNYPPHGIGKLDGGIEGFNIDLGNEIARRLGRKLDIESAGFAGLIPGLQAGKYDWLIAVVGVTKERAEALLFSEPYLDSDFQFAVRKGATAIGSLDDLRGKTIALNKGSSYENWAKNNAQAYGFKFDAFDTSADALQAVLSGRAQAVLSGDTSIKWLAKKNPLVEPSLLVKTGLQWALPFRKDDTVNRKAVSDAIKCMKQDGSLAKIYEKWLDVSPAPDSTAVKVRPGYGVAGLPGYDPTPANPVCS